MTEIVESLEMKIKFGKSQMVNLKWTELGSTENLSQNIESVTTRTLKELGSVNNKYRRTD